MLRAGIVTTGHGTYGNPKIVGWDVPGSSLPAVEIGRFCAIAEDVTFAMQGSHRTRSLSTYPFVDPGPPFAANPGITVGHDAWIGYGAIVLGGVRIGTGAVIAAGAVVTRDVREYAIVAGNPATEVRRRFSDADVQRLLEIAWWDLCPEQSTELKLILNSHLHDLDRLENAVDALRNGRPPRPQSAEGHG
jgi:virginiamycin A acetyltransferase